MIKKFRPQAYRCADGRFDTHSIIIVLPALKKQLLLCLIYLPRGGLFLKTTLDIQAFYWKN